MPETIRLHELSKAWAIRQNALQVFERIEKSKNKEFIVDFKDVEAINRSFAQEYLNRKEILKSKKITEMNMSKSVKTIFEIVESPNGSQLLNVNAWKVVDLPT
jgi:anti-anti-sigma regulatory factor